jgi:hypothetical protein
MNRRPSRRNAALALGLALGLAASAASAQQLILKGEFGMMAGTMAPPGLYVGAFGGFNWADELKTGSGSTIKGPKLSQEVFGPLVMWVSDFKILGASYGALVGIPWSNTRVEFPHLNDQGGSTGIGFSQLWVVPFSLGWHIKDPLPLSPGGADITFHYAFYPPTGRYTPGAPNNTGLGMWSNELSARLTAFFDKDRNWHGSASLFYDINSKKEGLDWTTGNPFTFMGGLGRNFGAAGSLFSGWAGVAGYSQWQVTSTTGSDAPLVARLNKTTIYGVGPELTALKGALTIRYFWQFGGKFSVQGQGMYVQLAMPLPF